MTVQPALFDLPPALLPTVPGYTTGIVSVDPYRMQCGMCGRVDEKPDALAVAVWVMTSGSLFCAVENWSVRRCLTCVEAHRVECWRCRR